MFTGQKHSSTVFTFFAVRNRFKIKLKHLQISYLDSMQLEVEKLQTSLQYEFVDVMNLKKQKKKISKYEGFFPQNYLIGLKNSSTVIAFLLSFYFKFGNKCNLCKNVSNIFEF